MIIYRLNIDTDIKKIFVRTGEMLSLVKKLKAGIRPDPFEHNSEKKGANWNPPDLRWYDDDGRNINKYKDPDISYLDMSGRLIFSPHSTELMKKEVSDVAEFLPVLANNNIWYYLNVFNLIDAYDLENSKYKIYSDGEKGYLLKPAFFPNKVPHAKLFVNQGNSTSIYYAEHHSDNNPSTFKNMLEKNNLSGIHLEVLQKY